MLSPLAVSGHAAAVVDASVALQLEFDAVVDDWSSLATLRSAASARQKQPFFSAVSTLCSELQVSLLGGYLDEVSRLSGVVTPATGAGRQSACKRYEQARFLSSAGLVCFRELWHWRSDQTDYFVDQIASVIGSQSPPGFSCDSSPSVSHPPSPRWRTRFEHSVPLLLACVAHGWSPEVAIDRWAAVDWGFYSTDGKTFFSGDTSLVDLGACEWFSLAGLVEDVVVHVALLNGAVRAITSSVSLRLSGPHGRDLGRGELVDLPYYVVMALDELGEAVLPSQRSTTIVERREAWTKMLGVLDAVTQTIVDGRLVLPKTGFLLRRLCLANHPSFENDTAAKEALGKILAKWIFQGILEHVGPDDVLPALILPCGAVPKSTFPFYRLITDARPANHLIRDWGVSYTSVSQLCDLLCPRDWTWGSDIEDAYHLVPYAGCGGELRDCPRPVLLGNGRIRWVDGKIVGCSPRSCKGLCDKSLGGIMIGSVVFRFAACQFGQKVSGSPLHTLMKAIVRGLLRRLPPIASGVWVDDMTQTVHTPPHPRCGGFVAGCLICTEARKVAVIAQAYWKALCPQIGVPLAPLKGHLLDQGGSHGGMAFDTVLEILKMLPEKLASLVRFLEETCVAPGFVARSLASLRGKIQHYSWCIHHIRVVCASISALIGEDDDQDWDRVVFVPTEVRDLFVWVLDILKTSVFVQMGRPLWPLIPSSAFGAFLRGDNLESKPFLVITCDASIHGWGAVARLSPDQDPFVMVGHYRSSREFLSQSFPSLYSGHHDPDSQVLREARAIVLAVAAASRRYSLRDHTLLIRSDCEPAISVLQKGSSSSSALQGESLAFARFCVDHQLATPLFLHIPGSQMVAEGVDALSRLHAVQARLTESNDRLRGIVRAEAARLGWSITIDLFASMPNALTTRFYSRAVEPEAEGVDALSQPDWGSSVCPSCCSRCREVVFAFPPRGILSRVIRKLEADRARGIIVLPFAITLPFWTKLMNVSLTGRAPNRCIVLRDPSMFLKGAADYGAIRLAVVAFDFWPRHLDRAHEAVCGQEYARRHVSWLRPEDQVDRHRMDDARRQLPP
mmetsp:Transcript_37009/g.98320  ORF Transcript_37009/g.98320 Transcript_37009/m.98320 type:complete len:1072 (+) Transcript_37009:2523-5738(+)